MRGAARKGSPYRDVLKKGLTARANPLDRAADARSLQSILRSHNEGISEWVEAGTEGAPIPFSVCRLGAFKLY